MSLVKENVYLYTVRTGKLEIFKGDLYESTGNHYRFRGPVDVAVSNTEGVVHNGYVWYDHLRTLEAGWALLGDVQEKLGDIRKREQSLESKEHRLKKSMILAKQGKFPTIVEKVTS